MDSRSVVLADDRVFIRIGTGTLRCPRGSARFGFVSVEMAIRRTGDWSRARAFLAAAPQRLPRAIQAATRQEAQALRNEIVRGLTRQAPGGGARLKRPKLLTLAGRRLRRFEGTKALLVRGDLRNSIGVIVEDGEVFVGVLRRAKSKSGEDMVNIARVQEYGSQPIVIPITPKMRRFLFALYKEAGIVRTPGPSKGVVVLQIPARPFLRPAFEKFKQGASRRFLERVAKELGLGAGL